MDFQKTLLKYSNKVFLLRYYTTLVKIFNESQKSLVNLKLEDFRILLFIHARVFNGED